MEKENSVELKVWGKYALFTDPLTRIGGEKYSYQIPTYEAIKGILCSVYWKPTFIWVIDKIRIMTPIKNQTKSAKPIVFSKDNKNGLAYYTYLADVEYQIKAHFEWNLKREDLKADRNENKHYFLAKRMIERGGRRDVFLGTRECQGYVEECSFGSETGYYDDYPDELSFGLMFHGFDYPDESKTGSFHARFWRPKMKKGIIEFARPDADDKVMVHKPLHALNSNPPGSVGMNESSLLAILAEE